MTYEVVQLNAKTIVGLQARSSTTDPPMGAIPGDLWAPLYAGLSEATPGKVNGKSIGLYTGYAGDSYDVVVGCEAVPGEALPAGVVQAVIPAGRYAKFVVHGDVQKDVAAFWEKLWAMDLPRAFTADFEEYQPGGDMQHAEIHIYIALK